MNLETFLKLGESASELFEDVERSYLKAVQERRAEYDKTYGERLADHRAQQQRRETDDALAGVRSSPLGGITPPPPPSDPAYYVSPIEFLLKKLTTEQRSASEHLRAELKKAFVSLAVSLRSSPVLNETDFRHFSILGKTIVAAVQFKEFRHWESKRIADDSGNILFVEPAGQEESLCTISVARGAFNNALTGVLELFEYLPSSQESTAIQQLRLGNTVPPYRPNTAFIMMRIAPDDPADEDLIDRIEQIFASFGIKARRIDRVGYDEPITVRIVQEIIESEFLFADLTGERPSVYYEVGYAHALKKRVMLFRQKGCKIHFDLANYPCPEYRNLKDLDAQLTARLEAQGLVRATSVPNVAEKVIGDPQMTGHHLSRTT